MRTRIASTVYKGCCLPLIDFLASRFTYHSRENWADEVTNGHVLIDGKTADQSALITHGALIEYIPVDIEEPPVDPRLQIMYEDDDLLIVDKSADLPVHPAGRYFKNTLVAILKEKHPGARIMTRLDRETSGLVLVAKHADAASGCSSAMKAGEIKKTYCTAVHGVFPAEMAAKGFIYSDKLSSVRKKRRFSEHAPDDARNCETCETHFECVETLDGISLVKAVPVTGRTHQIRATLCSLGYPMVGDKIYGVDETIFERFISEALSDDDERKLILKRQALHCAKLEICLGRRKDITAESDIPWEWPIERPE